MVNIAHKRHLQQGANSGTPDYPLAIATLLCVVAGITLVYSASFVEAYTLHNNNHYYLLRQIIAAVIGVGAMFTFQRIPYHTWHRHAVTIYAGAIVLLILVLILPSSITTVNNSRSWIRFGRGVFSIQPSELAKLALIIYISRWHAQQHKHLRNFTYGLLPFAILLGITCGLVMLEPDRGTTIILFLIGGSIYFAAGANLWHIVGATSLSVGAFWVLVNGVQPNARIAAFKDPWLYYSSYGYQPIHALYALGSGGLSGMGLGQSRQKFQWLPQAHTDAIYAIIGEEFGLIGTLLVLGGFVFIAYRGYRIALRAPDMFGALVAIGITSWLFLQAMVNIAVTTSLIPFTGITLPFFSYGGTSLISCLAGVGILLNISQHTNTMPTKERGNATHTRTPTIKTYTRHYRVPLLPQWWRNGRSRVSGIGGGRGTAKKRGH